MTAEKFVLKIHVDDSEAKRAIDAIAEKLKQLDELCSHVLPKIEAPWAHEAMLADRDQAIVGKQSEPD